MKIKPTNWQTQVKIFEKCGCVFIRQKGDHLIFHHEDAKRAIVIPKYDEIQSLSYGTIGKSSEITISLNFTAEHAENAEASENPSRIGTVLKLCALRGDKSLDF